MKRTKKLKHCDTKEQLLSAYQEATETYSAAVSELSRRIGTVPRSKYDKLTLTAERARRLSYVARERFDAHVDEHNC